MSRAYDKEKDVVLVDLGIQKLEDGREVVGDIFSYDGGSPKLRVRVGHFIAIKADKTLLCSGVITKLTADAMRRWPKEET